MGEPQKEEQRPISPFESKTRQPFDLSDDLKARVASLSLAETVQHVKEEGYGYIYDAAPVEFIEGLKEAIYRTVQTLSLVSIAIFVGATSTHAKWIHGR